MANAAATKARSDAELELMFPQHPWRAPVPVRLIERPLAPLFGCRFCLYRQGLSGQMCWPSAGAVERHLADMHPV